MPPRRVPLFTIGYEGKELGEVIAMLQASRVALVIDIRELPLSRRRGFSKTPLGAALREAGIEYVHLRAAGNPYRHDPERQTLLQKYARHLDRHDEIVDEVAGAARGRRAALLCYEAEAPDCHRSVLAARVAARLNSRVQDL
jgi:uncharacterized protein (DUF488 family)